MTRQTAVIAMTITIALGTATMGRAATCTVAGRTWTCDWTCQGNCNFASGGCDVAPTDGVCVLCGTTAAQSMTGSSSLPNVLCGKGGSDILTGGSANDVIDGGPNNDTIYAGQGDDEVYGGTGNDTIYGQYGNDTLNGGAGNDFIQSAPDFSNPAAHSINVCGGTGSDTLVAFGFGHQCLDGGEDNNGSDVDDCTYIAPVAPAGNKSVGSFRHCESENFDTNAVILSTDPPCGCWGDF